MAYRCLLCDHDACRQVLVTSVLTLVRCRRCAFVQLDPVPTAAQCRAEYVDLDDFCLDLLADEHLYVTRDRAVLAELAATGASGPLLDVGAGAGIMLGAAVARGWPAVGLELSRGSAALIRQRHGVTVHELPIEEAPLADGGFGVVTFSHSLEHLRDPVQALRRTRQLLRPGGRVHVAVPNWRAAKRLAAGARIAWIYPGHVSYFTRATLQAALQRAGFAVAAARTLPMVCALDYRFAVAVTERWRCDGLVRRFLRLGDSGLSTLIGNDIVIACPVWRFRLVLALARLGLRLWPERLLGLFGCAEELRVTATAV